MIPRAHWIALACAGAIAVGMPALLLPAGPVPPPPPPRAAPQPLGPPSQPPLTVVFERSLFGRAEPAETRQDAPALVGIVGRLDRDAVAMVRGADGTTRTLRIGESVDGWTLASLAIDAAFFTRGGERVRVALPAADQ